MPIGGRRPGHALVAVVVVLVVTPQSSEAAQADGVGEEDLGPGIHPHLGEKKKKNGKERERGVKHRRYALPVRPVISCDYGSGWRRRWLAPTLQYSY